MMKKNILFILPYLPWPLVRGGHQALFNGIDCLKEDFNIFVAFYSDGEPNPVAVEEFTKRIPNTTLFFMDTSYRASSFVVRVINKIQRILTKQVKKLYCIDRNELYYLWLYLKSYHLFQV